MKDLTSERLVFPFLYESPLGCYLQKFIEFQFLASRIWFFVNLRSLMECLFVDFLFIFRWFYRLFPWRLNRLTPRSSCFLSVGLICNSFGDHKVKERRIQKYYLVVSHFLCFLILDFINIFLCLSIYRWLLSEGYIYGCGGSFCWVLERLRGFHDYRFLPFLQLFSLLLKGKVNGEAILSCPYLPVHIHLDF